MKKMYMMCGLPRSGKSTWINSNKGNAVIVCADSLRYLVYNQRFWDSGEPLMWSIHTIMLKALLEQGVNIIVDETNTTPQRRKPLIDLAKRYGYTVTCVRATASKELCLHRAEENGDNHIKDIIYNMAMNFVEPKLEEGFESIIKI